MYLQTQRLLLRNYRLDDEDAIRELDTDPEAQRERGVATITEQHTRDKLQQLIVSSQEVPRDHYNLAICLPEHDRLIGMLSLHFTRPELREAEIGCTISRRYRGCGYATEAARAILRYGFEGLGLHRIVASCRAENQAAVRVMEKLGMRREADATGGHDLSRYALHASGVRAR